MTVTAPPSPPHPVDEIGPLDALIEEARRRARRRRQRFGACALLLAAAGAYLAFGRGGDGDGTSPPAPVRDAPATVDAFALDRVALQAGRLTLIGLPLDRERANPGVRGWFELSVLDTAGRLRPFIRCPDGRDYCGVVESVDWSPNGHRLAFTVGAHGAMNPYIGLHVVDVMTGKERRIADGAHCAFVERSGLAWSADGSRLAYTCSRPDRRRAIVIVEPGAAVRLLRTGTAGTDSSPTWSPGGDRIAFATKAAGAPPTISVVSVNGWGSLRLASDATAPDWSPDGSTIAYRAGCGGVKLVTPIGRDVTPARGPFRCRAIGVPGTPVWLPDGERIAISNRSGIYVVNKDGSKLRRLTKHTGIGHHGGRPAWRPG